MNFTPTILTQIFKQINRLKFQSIVKDNSADKYVKKISSVFLLNLMIFAQLSETKSMRHLVQILKASSSKLYHLGLKDVSLNGISHALSNRPSEVYRKLFYSLQASSIRKKTPIGKNLRKFVSIVDSTSMPFKGKGSDWAQAGKSRREARAHVLIDANGNPLDMVVTGAQVHEIRGFKKLDLGKTEILIMDRAYYGYGFWEHLIETGIVFVTRGKRNMIYEVISNRKGRRSKGVIEDQRIWFYERRNSIKRIELRRIKMITPKGVIVFITNDLQSPAKRICELYKSRWEIEIFFKWIKQNLKIKRFLGRNKNAIEIQLWVAMIVYLILQMIKNDFKFNGSILDLIRLISLKLLCHVGMADMLSPPKSIAYQDWKVGSLFNSLGQ